MDGVQIAGYQSPGGDCHTIHTLNGGLTFHDTGNFCSALKSPKFEVQLCGPGPQYSGCVTVATFTRDSVWRSFCAPCMVGEDCGDQQHINDYPVGNLNAPCFDE
jgi:hypothetical protein